MAVSYFCPSLKIKELIGVSSVVFSLRRAHPFPLSLPVPLSWSFRALGHSVLAAAGSVQVIFSSGQKYHTANPFLPLPSPLCFSLSENKNTTEREKHRAILEMLDCEIVWKKDKDGPEKYPERIRRQPGYDRIPGHTLLRYILPEFSMFTQ